MPDPTPPAPAIPTITGSPQIDSALRSVILSAAGALAGIPAAWLWAHGFTDPNLLVLITTAIAGLLTAIAGGLWGVFAARAAKLTVAQQTLVTHLAVQQAVQAPVSTSPEEQKAIIAGAQAVVKGASEEDVTRAMNASQLNPQGQTP